LATEGLPGYECVLDGCELTVDVAAIVDKFSGLAVAVAVALSCRACLEEACKRNLACCCFFLCTSFLLLYLGPFEQHVPHIVESCFFALGTHDFLLRLVTQLSSLLWELLCVCSRAAVLAG